MVTETRPFDPDALREKYRQERDKRLREDGNQQYVEVKGEFAHFVDDPYVEPGFEREPLTDDVDVVVIGGGFGGLLAGARLREAGVDDIRMIEKGGDFGGTWYWNRYPGAACDVESYVYLPLLEEIGYIPIEKYSRAPEILAHSARDRQEVRPLPRRLLPDRSHRAALGRGRRCAGSSRRTAATACARASSCMANGPLHRAKLPGIPGIETFKGHSFHTSRWDYDYTGGTSEGNLTGLRDKRVGIIGTGATAVQCVPHVGAAAKQLYVFQRTPSSIDVRANRPTDPEWAASLQPGWQQERMDNFNMLVSGGFQEDDLVSDGWTDIIRKLLVMIREDGASDLSPEGAGTDDGAGRLREDGGDPRARRRDRRRSGDGRSAEAVLPPVLQAPVLPRRVPRHLQPPERARSSTRRARASSGSRSRASSRTARSTSWTA